MLFAYCERMDAGDFAGVGELFAHGALVDPAGREIARGREAVAAFYRRIVILHDGSPGTKHLTTDPVVTLDGDTATSRAVYTVYQPVGGRPTAIATGRYDDRFERVDGTWRFTERRFVVEHVGDTSRHLRIEVPHEGQ